MRSAASVTVVGLNELPLFTVISDSNAGAAGNHLGFGLQPMLHVVSLGTALIHVNEVCFHGDPVSRRPDINPGLVSSLMLASVNGADPNAFGADRLSISEESLDGMKISREPTRALWGVDPTGGCVNSAPAGSADGRSAGR